MNTTGNDVGGCLSRRPGELHLYTPTFDNPAAYPPTFHVHWTEKLAWLGVMDSLPKHDHSSTPADTSERQEFAPPAH